ncbi:probable beta-D-galactosidase [Bacteroides pyogenes JCM 10003]|nr:probable beta-D-galactosidase [Bacteroides pyogenes JCM 10003]
MIVDTLENIEKYVALNPLFAQAVEFLKSHDLQAMEAGKTEVKGKELVVNIVRTKPKKKEEARLEATGSLSIFSCLCRELKSSGILLWPVVFRQTLRLMPKTISYFSTERPKPTFP